MWHDLGNLIVAKDFKNLPKVQKIAQSGHTAMHKTINAGYKCSTNWAKDPILPQSLTQFLAFIASPNEIRIVELCPVEKMEIDKKGRNWPIFKQRTADTAYLMLSFNALSEEVNNNLLCLWSDGPFLRRLYSVGSLHTTNCCIFCWTVVNVIKLKWTKKLAL